MPSKKNKTVTDEQCKALIEDIKQGLDAQKGLNVLEHHERKLDRWERSLLEPVER
jgi:hypothetical protein